MAISGRFNYTLRAAAIEKVKSNKAVDGRRNLPTQLYKSVVYMPPLSIRTSIIVWVISYSQALARMAGIH